MYSLINFKAILRNSVPMIFCAVSMTACITLSSLPSDGTDPTIAAPGATLPERPEYYLNQNYSAQQIMDNRRLTMLALQKDCGKFFVQTDGTWTHINDYELSLFWRTAFFAGANYEKEYGIINGKVFRNEYKENPQTGYFDSTRKDIDGLGYSSELRGNPDGSLTFLGFGYNKDSARFVRALTSENVRPDGSSQRVTFMLNRKNKWLVSEIQTTEPLPDGRIRETTTPYKGSFGSDDPTTMYMVPVSPEAFAKLGPLVKQREAERRQEEAQNKQARSDARWATFGAIVQGLGQATSEVASRQNAELARSNSLNNTLAQITQDAARKRQAALAAEQQTQASSRAEEQRAGREAAARQLAEANAYRSRQAAKTSDPAALRRLQADNEKALLAARQLGVEHQVRAQAAAQQRQAATRLAQVKRGLAQQAPVPARGQMSGSMVPPRQPTSSGGPVVQQSFPDKGGRLPVSHEEQAQSAPRSIAVQYQTVAMAWCYRLPRSGAFLCSGPLQMMTIVGEADLKYALKLAGCQGGEGRVPGLGASEKFNCGRMLGPNERRVADQSPYPD